MPHRENDPTVSIWHVEWRQHHSMMSDRYYMQCCDPITASARKGGLRLMVKHLGP